MKPHEIQEKLGLTRIRDRNWRDVAGIVLSELPLLANTTSVLLKVRKSVQGVYDYIRDHISVLYQKRPEGRVPWCCPCPPEMGREGKKSNVVTFRGVLEPPPIPYLLLPKNVVRRGRLLIGLRSLEKAVCLAESGGVGGGQCKYGVTVEAPKYESQTTKDELQELEREVDGAGETDLGSLFSLGPQKEDCGSHKGSINGSWTRLARCDAS
ncbi:hypothetical protein Z043_113591 [Scleropages formosus]|uniref:Uncharacterized protein n=1 Tax=Scleropages formosus TaxID=113540 RepID=A0A0N8JYX8_SCLFO|nr:hypothetical protein Z043_113591 [Scleropages formosus]